MNSPQCRSHLRISQTQTIFNIFFLGNCNIDQPIWDFLLVCETDVYFPLVNNLIDKGLKKRMIY
jgi:hypothetical protein